MHLAETSQFSNDVCPEGQQSHLSVHDLSDPPSLDSEMEQDDAGDASSWSNNDDHDDVDSTVTNTSHLVSPQTICSSRKLSLPVVTDPNATHILLEGREKIVLPLPTTGSSGNRNRSHQPQPPLQKHTTNASPSTFANDPPPMRVDAWAPVDATSFSVRGPLYLHNGGKVPSAPSLFRLLAVDMVSSRTGPQGLCSHPQERLQRALARERLGDRTSSSSSALPAFVFAVNLCIPAPALSPAAAASSERNRTNTATACTPCYHWVAYFGIDDTSLLHNDDDNNTTPLSRLTHDFFFGSSDTFRDQTLKLIPRVTEGNFVVRKAVGTKPSLLGTKLQHTYFRTDRYLEVLVDIGSDALAHRIVQLALGYAKHLTVDMAFVLEAKETAALPERILGAVRVQQVDIHTAGRGDGQRELLLVASPPPPLLS